MARPKKSTDAVAAACEAAAVATVAELPPPAGSTFIVPAGQGRKLRPRLVSPEYVESLRAYSKLLFDGGLVPKASSRPEGVAVLIEIGRDVGLPATMAVSWVAIINGRPSIWGDAAAALVRSSGLLVSVREWYEGEGDGFTACCELVRVGAPEPRVARFSVADAKRARLWGKAGPWTEYPERQLMWRARGWAYRDEFPDVLCGLIFAEEAKDMPRVVVAQDAEGDAEPIRPAAAPVGILDVAPAPAPAPAAPTPAATSDAATTPAKMTHEQAAEVDRLRKLFLGRQNITGGTAEAGTAWAAFVNENTEEHPRTLKAMSEPQAAAFLAAAGAILDPAAYPTAPAPATAPTPLTAPEPAQVVTADQLEEVLRLQGLFFDSRGIHDATTDEARAAWAEFVFTNTSPGVRSVKHLNAGQADRFILGIGRQLDPFQYPPASAG